jgi:hypothetical protein
MPLQHRHGYAAGFPRGLPASTINRHRSRPLDIKEDVHCAPAHIRQVGAGGTLEEL